MIYFLILSACLFLLSCPYHKILLQQTASLDTIKVTLRQMERERRKESKELKADVETRLEKMEEELRIIGAKLEDLLQREGRILRPAPETSPVPDTFFLSGEELYNQSHLDFTRGEYDLAIQGFKNYLEKFPNTELSDNAQYWIGECYYSKGEYDRAIEEFKKVEENYPQGNKVPSALYKIGLIYLKMGKKKEGETYLRRVINSFPNSPEAKQAKERIKG
ncbi:MAG: tol-pal system protein YbgF [candidate division WOR-3 bacterium]